MGGVLVVFAVLRGAVRGWVAGYVVVARVIASLRALALDVVVHF